MANFVEELKWRGMIHDIMPGTEEQLQKEMTSAYIGFDPTADSLHVGNLATIMLLVHFQRAGHKPYVLVGGATGRVGDPSGKSAERKLLDVETLTHNLECQKKQLQKFLSFGEEVNAAEVVNNYDWFKEYLFLDFIRDVGKHISVNYMMAKDSVKSRLETGMSFTEFSYQLIQGYDFLHLYKSKDCKLQMGGSDQWGNITTGTELIRRMEGGEAFALTTPLLTRADGGKFGKSEQGNVWLDPERTSPYTFYQFWLNTSDADAGRFLRVFSLLEKAEIEALEKEHAEAPHARILQKKLAEEVTVRVHSREEYEAAVEASQILFGKGTTESLKKMDERTFLSVFEGVPRFSVQRALLEKKVAVTDLLTEHTSVFASKGELRRLVSGGGLSLNKEKVESPEYEVGTADLLSDKYLLVQKGKKNYFLLHTED